MSDPSPEPPSCGEEEPTMVSVPVVGSMDDTYTTHLCSNRSSHICSTSAGYLNSSMDADSTSESLGACDERMMVDCDSLTVNAIVTQESVREESENSDDHLSVIDNITAQNFLQESDLMNAASSALGHRKSPTEDLEKSELHHNLLSLEHHSVTSSQDHLEMQSLLQEQQDLEDGSISNYHMDSNSQAGELSVESVSHLEMGGPEVGHSDGVCLSPSSNSSTSSMDLHSGISISSGIGLPPVSTIIRSSAKGRFDIFCRPSNINLIMGMPQYNSFDVITSMNNRLVSSPCDSLSSVSLASPIDSVSSSRHNNGTDVVMGNVPLSSSLICSSGESRCIKANTVMSSMGPGSLLDKSMTDDSDEHRFNLPARTLANFEGVPLMQMSPSPSQHMSSPTLEEMQKVAEISEHLQAGDGMEPFTLHAGDESIARVILSPHFSVGENIHHTSNYVECLSQRCQTTCVSAIETNVIMSTSNIDSSSHKFTAADIKAIEQQLRNDHQSNNIDDAGKGIDRSVLETEVIIPDTIDTSQNSAISYSDVQEVLNHNSEEDRKILKAHNITRSSIIEKNMVNHQPRHNVKAESSVITCAEPVSAGKAQHNESTSLLGIEMGGKAVESFSSVNPSAVTASVIQQLLRSQSPPVKLRTRMDLMPRGVITSTKGDTVVHQNILVPSSVSNLVEAKKNNRDGRSISVSPSSIPKMDNEHKYKSVIGLEHSVIKSSSDEKEVTTVVLPSLFSNLSASALASLQSSLTSALPLTIQSSLPSISIGDDPPVSPSLSSPPLSPISLPSILSSTLRNSGSSLLDSIINSNCVTSTNNVYSGLLKTVGLSVKREPGMAGSGPLPPFTVVSGLSPLVKRSAISSNLIGASPTSARIPVVTIKQEPGLCRASASASEFNPSIILNAAGPSIQLPSAAAVQLPVVVTSSVAISTAPVLTNPVPSQATTIAFSVSSGEEGKGQDKNCPMCKKGSPCGLHPTRTIPAVPPQPVLSGDPAKPFQCTLCGKHLASKNVYQLHLRSHSGEKPFTCNLCGHHFSQKTSLTRHMRSHTGERPFPCDVCGKRFADKERIKIHMRTHTGEKPFACEVCGKRFSQKSTVKRHMSVHTGEKPFRCESCGKGFANRGNLNAHSKTHANT